ncbi:MAG: 1-acyl-sn-glycerol-3-phosphate acyltransferase [Anaerolineales bacterium]
MSYPKYSYAPTVIASLIRDGILDHRRVFRDDARLCIERLNPPLQVLGKENIPQRDPCVLTMNHYTRTGFHIWWGAMAVSSSICAPVRWVIAGEWTAPGKWYELIKGAVSRFAANRIARVYGFTTMPPMPPRPRDVEARAASVLAVLKYVKQTKDAMIGFAPEGGDQIEEKLMMPASGVGRFGLLLAAQGLRFAPVGVYESNGELRVHFGEAYDLCVERHGSSDEKDQEASRTMMKHIASLLPSHLRGEFV